MAASKTGTQGLRVLFLHELEGAPGSEKQRLVEKAVGKQRVKTPNLKTRQFIMLFVLLFLVLALILLGAVIASIILAKWYVWVTVLIVSLVILGLTYWLGGRAATHFMVLHAARIAAKKFKEQRPNVIVGTSFGSVVALSMDVPKVALLLLAPAQEQYTRFMRLKTSPFSLSGYPYVMIVHGSADKTVPLDDSIRLVETAEVGRCRLEVVDDGHALKSITSDDLRAWIEEVYINGKENAQKMAKEGAKDIDISLFDEPNDTDTAADTLREKDTKPPTTPVTGV